MFTHGLCLLTANQPMHIDENGPCSRPRNNGTQSEKKNTMPVKGETFTIDHWGLYTHTHCYCRNIHVCKSISVRFVFLRKVGIKIWPETYIWRMQRMFLYYFAISLRGRGMIKRNKIFIASISIKQFEFAFSKGPCSYKRQPSFKVISPVHLTALKRCLYCVNLMAWKQADYWRSYSKFK